MNKMKDKVVIITGAGGGIGLGVAEAFAQESASIVITDINQSKLDNAKKFLTDKYPVEVLAVLADGSVQEDVKRCVKETANKFGKINVLINNAQASTSGKTLLEQTKEDFDLTFGTGLYASFYYMKECFLYLKETKGSIINFASESGIQGKEGQGAYGANKEAIRCLTRVADNEWGEYGINVNNICPLVYTARLDQWKNEHPDLYKKTIQNIPLRRFGDPVNDIGRVCLFLASEDASFISGETISVQGGAAARP